LSLDPPDSTDSVHNVAVLGPWHNNTYEQNTLGDYRVTDIEDQAGCIMLV